MKTIQKLCLLAVVCLTPTFVNATQSSEKKEKKSKNPKMEVPPKKVILTIEGSTVNLMMSQTEGVEPESNFIEPEVGKVNPMDPKPQPIPPIK